ncbi:conserved protein of unknown function [Paraburkholderia dioscoreae]|uniref:Uncharacterized protein n=1 Tax=Paraburkholderia dioscoreae TaxID=2604047 RepID=A0A5Q4ZDC2_9BURK|nr:conserved protein of unknown function [Paraburkholderia dioscoreae]
MKGIAIGFIRGGRFSARENIRHRRRHNNHNAEKLRCGRRERCCVAGPRQTPFLIPLAQATVGMLLSALKGDLQNPTLHSLHLSATMEVAMESYTNAAYRCPVAAPFTGCPPDSNRPSAY